MAIDDEIMEVFCPGCGQAVKCEKSGEVSGISAFFDGNCDECEKLILVEDRASFEQDGTIEVIFK